MIKFLLSYSFCLLIFFITSEILSPTVPLSSSSTSLHPLRYKKAPNPRSLHFLRPFHFHFNSLHSPPLTPRSENTIFSDSNLNSARASSLHPWAYGFDCIFSFCFHAPVLYFILLINSHLFLFKYLHSFEVSPHLPILNLGVYAHYCIFSDLSCFF